MPKPQRFREGQHVRDRLTHEALTIDTIYGDGCPGKDQSGGTADGREQHVELQDIEPDPSYEGR